MIRGRRENSVKRDPVEQQKPEDLQPRLRRKPRSRRFRDIACRIGLLLIGFIVVLSILPVLPPFKGKLLSFFNRRISSSLACNADIGAITFELWNGIVLKNAVLSDPDIRREPIHVERIAAKVDLISSLNGHFELRSIKIEGFTGELHKKNQGIFLGPIDIGGMMRTTNEKRREMTGPARPLVRSIELERCSVSFVDSAIEITAAGTILSARLKWLQSDSLSFVVKTGNGKISSPVWRGDVRSIQAQGIVGSASMQFSKAEIKGDSIQLLLDGTIPFSTDQTWDLSVNIEAFTAGFAKLYKNVPSLKPVGTVKAKGLMKGTFQRPVLDLTFTAYGLQSGFVKTDSIFMKAHYSNNLIRGQGRLWSSTGTVDASARVKVERLFSSPAVGQYTFTASAANVNIRNLISGSMKKRHRPVFMAEAGLFAAGSGFRRFPDTLTADIRKSTNRNEANPGFIAFRMAENKWDLTARVKPDFEVKGKGRVTNRGAIDGSFHIQADSIDRIVSALSDENVRGAITADARMSGILGNPAISATVQSGSLFWRDIQMTGLWARFALRNRVLFIDTSYISANGSITKVLKGRIPGEFSGTVWAKAGFSGRFDSLRIAGDIQTGPCSYGRYRADTVFARFRYANQSLRWRSLTIKLGKSEISSDGKASRANRIVSVTTDTQLSLDNQSAGSFSWEARFIPNSVEATGTATGLNPMVFTPWFPQAKRFQGSLNAHGTLSGESENPKLHLDFSFNNPVSNGDVLTSKGEMAFADSIATVTLNAGHQGSEKRLRITAHLPVSWHALSCGFEALKDGSVITIDGDSVSYGGMVTLFAPSVQPLGIISLHGRFIRTNGEWAGACGSTIINHSLTVKRNRIKAGRAVLDLQLDGSLDRPRARFTLNGDSIRYQGDLISSYSGSGSIVNDVLILDSLRLNAHGGLADIKAMVPFTGKNGFLFDKNSRMTATLTAMPFSIVQPLMPDPVTIQKGSISGRLDIQTTADGIRQVNGTLSLQNGEFSLYECDRPLDHLSMEVDFQNDLIILRRLRADWGGGHVTGTGRAVLDAKGVSHGQSDIRLRDVRLGGCTDNLDLAIQTGDIHLTVDSLINLKMNMLLANTQFSQDFSIIDLSERINRKAPQTSRPTNPLFKKVVMRIAVNLNSNLTLDSNLGRMLLDGTVTIAGRPDRPSIAGQFQVLNGFIYYLDRKFTITQGTIRQYDTQRINPSLDVTAVSGVSWIPPQGGQEDYEITLLIKGDLSNPAVTLSAVPSLPQQQIISLMTFGTIQMGSGTDLGPRTGSLVSQQLSGFGSRKLARFLNVESVGIYGNIFDPTSDEVQLAMTKQVSSRVMMTYRTGLSTLSQQTILVSYRLLPFLYFEAETDQQAQGGVDLKFRYSH